uniref:Uncharacterized protein n=1 Tax=Rhizophora mucronata TaxID=61149 RepID=A0A2P2Q9G3_RHIMU
MTVKGSLPGSTPLPPSPTTAWHSPMPYLFGGLAAMLGLIAFALLILACSYGRLSSRFRSVEGGRRDLERGNEKEGISSGDSHKVSNDKILVIMAGNHKPTFLATPVSGKASSSFVDKNGGFSDQLTRGTGVGDKFKQNGTSSHHLTTNEGEHEGT